MIKQQCYRGCNFDNFERGEHVLLKASNLFQDITFYSPYPISTVIPISKSDVKPMPGNDFI